MKYDYTRNIDILIQRYPALAPVRDAVAEAIDTLIEVYRNGGKLLVGGNGGSCADAEHIAGELLKGFLSKRPLSETEKQAFSAFGSEGKQLGECLQKGLPCVVLSAHTGFLTAFGNDVNFEYAYAQQLFAQGRAGDAVIGITCSGNAANIYHAFIAAKATGIKTILLTGAGNGRCRALADIVIAVPETEVYKIQELHLPVYHLLCMAVEEAIYGS